MPGARRFLRRLAALFRSGKAESDLAREIQAHLQLLEDRFVAGGMSRAEARRAARRAFGGVEQAKERQRDARTFRWLAGWPMDVKLGARMLVRSPGLTAIGVIALAVAIGAGAAYLELLRDWIHPRLAVAGSDRIVRIRILDVQRGEPLGPALYELGLWRGATSTLEHLGGVRPLDRPLVTADGRVEPARGVEVSAAAFSLFPATPLFGRSLSDVDERPAAMPVVVIGHDLWQSRFDGDPRVVGRTVELGSAPHTVVGVMPAGFGFPMNQNLWAPLRRPAAALQPGEGDAISLFARLEPGVSREAAQAELSALLPQRDRPMRVEVHAYLDLLAGEENGTMIVAVLYLSNLLFVMLLVICGANVATLVFARTAMREGEITVRTALGAGRARICAQLFAESLVLSLVAAAAGLTLAGFFGRWLAGIFSEAIGQPLPFWWNDSLSPTTVLYALALAVFAALIVGVVPALKATGARLQGRLREAGAGGSSMRFGRLWTGVIMAQTSLTVIFLAILVSLGWTVYRARQGYDVTFDRGEVLTARLLGADGTGQAGDGAGQAGYRALADRLREEPGVIDVTYATQFPGTTFGRFRLEFAPAGPGTSLQEDVAARATPHEAGLWARSARVGPRYFETVGVPLLAGRLFTESEIEGNRPVAIVDETFVSLLLGGRRAVGLLVREPPEEAGGAPGPWHEIVGVVGDVTIKPRDKSYDAMVYRPAAIGTASPAYLLVRTRDTASPLAHTLPAAALSATPDLRLADVTSLEAVADREALAYRISARAFGVAAAVALLLSTAGIYALVSFTLARRTREIGIRVALGAGPRRIITATFSRVFLQVAAGVILGALPGAAILVRGVEDQGALRDAGAGVTAAIGAFVIVFALVSCAVPLRRALRIEPVEALRADG